MQVGGAGQPRQEACVLDRIPSPDAAPAEHLVAPPAAEDDAGREEAPGEERPAPCLEQPALSHTTGDERGDGERERDAHADVAEVEHRRVEQHEHVVLQQLVRAPSVLDERRRGGEGVRGEERQRVEERADREQHDHRPGDERIGAAGAVAERDRSRVAAEHEDPQQQRTLERAPQCGEVVQRRCGAGADLLDVLQREVPRDERPFHRRERQDTGERHHPCVPVAGGEHSSVAAAEAEHEHDGAEHRCRQADEERGNADRSVQACCKHAALSAWSMRSALSSSYSFECFTSTLVPSKRPSRKRPATTTGMHSWNRSGSDWPDE